MSKIKLTGTAVSSSLTSTGSFGRVDIGNADFSGDINMTGTGVHTISTSNDVPFRVKSTDGTAAISIADNSSGAETHNRIQVVGDVMQLIAANKSLANLYTNSFTINEDSNDIDFRVEANDDANAFKIDAATNKIMIGTNVVGDEKFKVAGNVGITGSLHVSGNITTSGSIIAKEFRTEFVNQIIATSSGSTQFGDSIDDVHHFTGSLLVSGNINLPDSVQANFGNRSGGDMQIYHDGSNNYINASEGHLILEQNENDHDIILKSDNGSGGTTAYLTLDGSTKNINIDVTTRITKDVGDGGIFYMGADSDLALYVTGDHAVFRNYTSDGDIYLSVNDSGSAVNAVQIDASDAGTAIFNHDVHIKDNGKLKVGTGNDLEMYHDGSNSYFYNETGNFQIFNKANDKDIILSSDDGSGGTTAYLTIDGSSRNINVDIASYMDIKSADDGEGGITLSKSATDGTHTKYSISHRDDNQSLIIYSHDGTTFRNWFTADEPNALLKLGSNSSALSQFDNDGDFFPFRHIDMGDGDRIKLGDSDDLQIVHDSNINFIHSTISDRDIYFRVNDGGSSVDAIIIDASDVGAVKLPNDNQYLYIGAGNDIYFGHGGTNSVWGNNTGTLQIRNHTADADMFLSVNDGGSHINAIQIDASDVGSVILPSDNQKLKIGASNDLQIYHDGSNNYINNVTSDQDFYIKVNDGGSSINALQIDASAVGKVKLPNDNQRLTIGASDDLHLFHDGSDTGIENYVGDLYITNNADDKDIVLRSDNGSGGVTPYITLDGSSGMTLITGGGALKIDVTADQSVLFNRDGGSPVSIEHDTSQLYFYNRTQNKSTLMFKHAGPVVINEDSSPLVDFRIETDAQSHALFTNSSDNTVGIFAASSGLSGSLVVGGGTGTPGGIMISHQNKVGTSQPSTVEQHPVGHYTTGEEIFSIDQTWSDSNLAKWFGDNAKDDVYFTASADAPGGYAIRIDGQVSVGGEYNSGFPYIPIRDGDVYYMECWIQNVGDNQTHYMGSNEYDQNFASTGGNPGSYGYWVMSNTNTGTGQWIKQTGYISGSSISTTGTFETSSRYFTPMALFNYGAGSGTRSCVISGWKVVKMNNSGNQIFDNMLVSGSIALGNKSNTNVTGGLGLDASGSAKDANHPWHGRTRIGSPETLQLAPAHGMGIKTPHGYVLHGPRNSSWNHIITDRNGNYFNTKLTVDGGIVESYDEALQLRRYQSNNNRITIDDGRQVFEMEGRAVLNMNASTTTGWVGISGSVDISGSITSNGSAPMLNVGETGAGAIAGSAHQLMVGGPSVSGYTGIQIVSDATDGKGVLSFADGRGANDNWRGFIEYDHGSDILNFATNAVTRYTMNNAGCLYVSDKVQAGGNGIEIWDGTHGFKQVLGKDSTYTFLKNNDGVSNIYLGDSGDAQNYYDNGVHIFRSSGGGAEYARIGSGYIRSAGLGSDGAPAFSFTGDTDTGILSPGANNIALSTAGTRRYLIDASGNHSIYGNTSFSSPMSVNYGAIFNEGSHDSDFRVESNANTHMFLVDAGNNRIGINVSAPAKDLHIFQTEGAVGAKHSTLRLGGYSTTGCDISSFRDTGNSNDQGLFISVYNATNAQLDAIRIDSLANIQVTGSDGTKFMLSQSGDFHADGDVIAASTQVGSDIRLKDEVEDLNYGLDEVLKLRPVEFDWKTRRGGRHDIGVIAQEIESIIPEVVTDSKDIRDDLPYKSVDYSKLTAVLIKAVQEQQEQIEELKEDINELRGDD